MAGGRPTKYNDETLSTAIDYIANYEEYGDVIPSIAGLACELGVARETVHAWVRDEDKLEFSHIIKGLLSAQERKLINGSLGNSLNPMISKLLLSGHGHSEKQDINHQSSDGSMTPKAYSQEDYNKAQSDISTELDDLD